MASVKIAAAFRHNPAEDGQTIPASLERQDPTCEWGVIVDPIIGFMCISFHGRTSWSFIKYDAPDARYVKPTDKTPRIKLARFGTTRVGHVTCHSCGNSCIYPAWGKQEEMRCSACGNKGMSVAYIRETDPEFFRLLGDLRTPLEDAVNSVDECTADEFRFPELLMLGHVSPSSSIPAALQGAATSRGLALKLARESTVEELFSPSMGGDDTGLLIMPGVVSGILDADKAREGWGVTEGVVSQYVGLPWIPKPRPTPPRFGGARL